MLGWLSKSALVTDELQLHQLAADELSTIAVLLC